MAFIELTAVLFFISTATTVNLEKLEAAAFLCSSSTNTGSDYSDCLLN